MVFLIQNTQNRDAKAVHLKLDEMIRALKGARNQLVDLEDLSDEELKKLEEQFQTTTNKSGTQRNAVPQGQIACVTLKENASLSLWLLCLACSQENFAAGT